MRNILSCCGGKTLVVQAETDFPIRTELFCITRIITAVYGKRTVLGGSLGVFISWWHQFVDVSV